MYKAVLIFVTFFCCSVLLWGIKLNVNKANASNTTKSERIFVSPSFREKHEVKEFTLSDGTRCIIVMTYGSNSVSCAWDIKVSPK